MNFRYILLAALFVNALAFAQTPGISYQAVILDDSGIQAPGYNLGDMPLANANVDLKFTITDEDGTLYVEEFTGITTDENGMVSLILGIDMGDPLVGSFSDIVWDGTPKDLGVEIDVPNDNLGYRAMGDPQPIIYIPSLDSRISSGEGTPSGTAAPAHIYVDESTGDVYTYDGDSWILQGSGVSSDTNNLLTLGSDSLAYLAADSIAETNTGSGAPSGSANPGDIYIDESTGDIYIYDGSSWSQTNASDGDSAYEVWLNQGHTGSEADYIEYLKGSSGDDGASAYDIWLAEGNSGTEAEFLTSLQGADGAGISGVGDPNIGSVAGNAGDIYVDKSTGDIYTYDGTTWTSQSDVVSTDAENIVVEGTDGLAYLDADTLADATGVTSDTGAPTATNPANPSEGDIYVDESTGDIYTYDGTTWTSQSDVVSTDADNIVVEGTDGLAYLDADTLADATGVTSDTGAPTATNPANPSEGDIYVDESTGDIYTYDGTTWTSQSDVVSTDAENIVVEGTDGLAYLDADTLADATGVTSDTGAPTATNPANPSEGDIYVDESTGDIYTYDGTTWTSQSDVVSTDADNIVVEGTDGLAYLDADTLADATGVTSDTGAPTATNPANPSEGDIYVDESTGDIYTYDGTDWTSQSDVVSTDADNIVVEGTDGLAYLDADTLADATGVTSDTGAPTATNPANPSEGDIYVDESTGDIYTYDGTTWTSQSDVVSTDAENIVVEGTDGLAYLDADTLADATGVTSDAGVPTATNPANPSEGDIYVDESTGDIYTYDGTTWTGQGGTDDQDATEVDTAYDADNDPATQDSVEDALTALDTAITDLEAANTADADTDPTNEIELPTGGTNGQLLQTDGSGVYTWVDDQTGTDDQTSSEVSFDDSSANLGETDVQGAIEALDTAIDNAIAADADTDPTNEIELPTGGTNGQLLQTDGSGVYTWVDDQTGTDDQTSSEVSFDDSSANLGETDVQGAIEALDTAIDNAIAADADTDPTNEIELPTGGTNGQLLQTDGSGVYTWVDDQTGTDDQTSSEVSFDDSSANLGETDVQGAIEALDTAIDNAIAADADTDPTNEIELPTGGTNGQLLQTDGSGVYTWVDDQTGTDDQTSSEVSFDDSSANLGETDVQGAIEALDTALDAAVAGSSDDQTISLTGTTLAIEDGNDVDLSGINTDDQTSLEVSFDDSSANLGETDVQGAIEALDTAIDNAIAADADTDPTNEIELPTGGTNGQLLQTDGSGVYTWVDDQTGTDDQTSSEVSFDDSSANLGETDVQGAIEALDTAIDNAIAADADTDPTNEIELPTGGTNGQLLQTDGSGVYTWVDDQTGTDDQTSSEVSFDDSSANLGETDVQGAIEALDTALDAAVAGSSDDQTISLTGTTLAIEDGNDVDLSGINTDDQTSLEVSFDDSSANLGETDVQGAIEALDTAIDNAIAADADTDPTNEIELPTGGTNGQLLQTDGSGVYTWVDDQTGTDDQTSSEVSFDDSSANLGETDVQGAIEALDTAIDNAIAADADTDPTNEIELPTGGTNGQLLQTDGSGVYTWVDDQTGTDDQTSSEVSFDDSSANLGETDVQGAIEALDTAIDNAIAADADTDPTNEIELPTGGTNGQLLQTDGSGVYTWVDDQTGTDDQTSSEVSFDDSSANLGETDVQGAIEALDTAIDNAIAADADTDPTNEIELPTGGTNGQLLQTDGSGVYTWVDDQTGTDDQTSSEVSFDDSSANLGETDVQGAIEALDTAIDNAIAADADTDPTNEIELPTGGTNGQLLQTDGSGVYTWVDDQTGTDDQTSSEVSFDDSSANLGETDVQGAIEALDTALDAAVAGSSDDQTISLTGTTLAIEDGNDVDLSGINTDDQTSLEVSFDDSSANLGETDVQGAIEALDTAIDNAIAADADTDPTNEIELPTGGTNGQLLQTDGSGVYTWVDDQTGTDDQTSSEVSFDDSSANLGETDVQGAIEALDTAIDNAIAADADTDPTNEIELPTGGTNGQLLQTDGSGVYTWVDDQTGTDDQTSSEVSFDDSSANLGETDVQGAIEALDTAIDNAIAADADTDPTNEIELPTGGTNGQLLQTDGSGVYTWVDDQTGTDDQTSSEVSFDDSSANLGETDVQGAIEALDTALDAAVAGSSDDQTISLTGTTLAIEDGNDVDLSGINTDDQTSLEVSFDDSSANLGETDVQGAIEALDTAIDNAIAADADTDPTNEIELPTGGTNGQLLQTDGSGVYTWVDDQTGTDDQTSSEVSFDDSSANLGETDVQGAIEALDTAIDNAIAADADTDPTNEIELPTGGTNGQLLQTDGSGVYTWVDDQTGTDDQTSSEVSFDDSSANLGETDVQGAIEALDTAIDNAIAADADTDPTNEIELPTGGTNGQLLQTDGSGVYTWVDDQTGTDDQTSSEVSFDDSSANLGETDVQGAIEALDTAIDNAIAADADTDPTNEIELPTGGTNGQLLQTDGSGVYTWVDDQTGTDDQTSSEVSFDDSSANLGETDVQGAIEALDTALDAAVAGSSDDQTISLTGTTLAIEDGNDVDLSGINTDDQTSLEVSFDDSSANLGETDVQGAIEALDTAIDNAIAADADTDPTNEIELPTGGTNGQLLQTDGSGVYTWVDDQTGTDDQTSSEVSFDDSSANLGETDVQGAIEALDTALDAISDTDDQDATEVALSPGLDMDSDGNAETTVQDALADLLTATTAAKQVFHAEYAGAILYADGSDNELFITSDWTGSPEYMNYYEVSNEETSGSDQDYSIIFQYTLPDDFESWASSDPITIEYEGTTDASFSVRIREGSSTLKSPIEQTLSGLGTWSTYGIATASQLSALTAGDTMIVIIKTTVSSVSNVGDSLIRLGDITLNYNRNVL